MLSTPKPAKALVVKPAGRVTDAHDDQVHRGKKAWTVSSTPVSYMQSHTEATQPTMCIHGLWHLMSYKKDTTNVLLLKAADEDVQNDVKLLYNRNHPQR